MSNSGKKDEAKVAIWPEPLRVPNLSVWLAFKAFG